MLPLLALGAAALATAASISSALPTVPLSVELTSPPEQQLVKFWQASVGSGHAKLGLRADWRAQLKAVHDDLGIHGVRFHGSFDDDMGPVAVADKTTGGISYNFTGLDALYDGIMAAGVKPIVELSFMPEAIANCVPGKCRTGMHYRGIEEHPRTWGLWGDLVHAFVSHLVQRHGLAEIVQWRFEVGQLAPTACSLYPHL